MNGTVNCEPSQRTASGVVAVLFIFQVFVNAAPLLAIICFRRSLSRLNSVYIYVKNTLLCNIVFGVSAAYTALNMAIVFERPLHAASENPHRYNAEDPAHRSIMMWWTFQKSFTLSLMFAMKISVVGLIFGLKQRTFLTSFSHSARLSSAKASSSFHNIFGSLANMGAQTAPQKTLFRRSQAYLIVIASWLVPTGSSLLATFSWNCRDTCHCLPAAYNNLQCYIPQPDSEDYWCSQEWLPMSGGYAVFCFCMWIVLTVVLTVMLVRSIRSYQWNAKFAKHHVVLRTVSTIPSRPMIPRDMTLHYAAIRQGRMQSFRAAIDSEYDDEFVDRPRLSTILEEPTSVADSSFPAPSEAASNSLSSAAPDILETASQPEHQPSTLSPSLKLVIILSASVTLSTLPVALVTLCDLLMPDNRHLNPVVLYLAFATLFVHVFSCPLFLVKYLSDLKQATNRLLLRVIRS